MPRSITGRRSTEGWKVRGLELRRHDTPPIVSRMQREILTILAEAHDYQEYCRKLEEARKILERCLERVEEGSATAVGRLARLRPGEIPRHAVRGIPTLRDVRAAR